MRSNRPPIPVVFLHPSDPVRDGLVKSLARPGGNLTGVFGPRDVVGKQLELYELLVPRLQSSADARRPERPDDRTAPAAVPGRGGRAAQADSARRPQGLDGAGSRAHLRLASPGRGRRGVPSVAAPSARLHCTDDPARQPGGGARAGAPEGLGRERRAVLVRPRSRAHRARQRPLRRQHPQRHAAGQARGGGGPRPTTSRSTSRPPPGSASRSRRT